ncbi:dihydrofolate reductase family protein [Rhodococcus sp. NM-2]|jgi:dihydrofolate reductase|uniref:Dihydrofolate reductase family protein n=1 Tax=Rhodococcus jostii TaxID=132919 RepID=A0ABU4CI32_RHOJO|nr:MULTISPECIES: dihydrofolate reductase family protein [Rhodococcus]MDH6289148.1 dihydrofolate reductase [Rhodococcus opacus]MDV6283205.1 dihydrofolate reductase family protein [Rhodococcus jostii]
MRKLVYYAAATIDGFIAGTDGSDPTGTIFEIDGDHMPVMIAEYPETVPTHMRAPLGIDAPNKHFDTLLMGRASYQPGLDLGMTSPYAHLRQYVFSTTITESPDPDVEIVSGDPIEKVRELKREDGKDIWLCGGGKLAAAVQPEIDELRIKLNPVAIGTGIPLFDGEFGPQRFRLAASRAFESGMIFLTYVRR